MTFYTESLGNCQRCGKHATKQIFAFGKVNYGLTCDRCENILIKRFEARS